MGYRADPGGAHTGRFASVEVDDIKDLTAVHIHIRALRAVGPVAVNLYTAGPVFTTSEKVVLVQGSFDARHVMGISYNDLVTDMRSADAYVDVHSLTFPDGELRGRLDRIAAN